MFSWHILCACVFFFLPSIPTPMSIVGFRCSVYSKWNLHPFVHSGQKAFIILASSLSLSSPHLTLATPADFPDGSACLYWYISKPPSSLTYTATQPVVPSVRSGAPPVYCPTSAKGHFPKYRSINQLIDLSFYHLRPSPPPHH